MLNKGLTGVEIAEEITLPPQLDDAWHACGYYGSVSHNVKAICQRYPGWFDGNPTSLWQRPPKAKPSATWKPSAASTPCWTRPADTPNPGTSASPPNCSSTRSSPNLTTALPRSSRRRLHIARPGRGETDLAELLPHRRPRVTRRRYRPRSTSAKEWRQPYHRTTPRHHVHPTRRPPRGG